MTGRRASRAASAVRLAAGAAVVALLALLLVFGLLQTPPAKSLLASSLSAALADADGRSAVVRGLSGVVPFAVEVERFELHDDEGEWLAVSALSWRLSVARLFAGNLYFDSAKAEELRLTRLPRSRREQAARDQAFAMPRLAFAQVHVDRLLLGAQLVGGPAAGAGARAQAEAAWIGPLRTRAAGTIGGVGPAVQVRLDAAGAARGLPGESECAAISIGVAATGRLPLATISTEIECRELRAPGLDAVRLELEGAAQAAPADGETAYRVGLRAALAAPVTAAGVDALLGESSEITAGLLLGGPTGALVLERARVEAAGADVTARGSVTRGGSAADAWRVELEPVTIERLELAALGVDSLAGHVSGAGRLAIGGATPLELEGALALGSVDVGGRALAELVGTQATLAIDGGLGRDGRVQATSVVLSGSGASVEVSGAASPSDGTVDLDVRARAADLAVLDALRGLVAPGTDAELSARLFGKLSRLAVNLDARSRAADLRARGRAVVVDGAQRVELESLEVDAPGASARASGWLDPASRLAAGTLVASSADLSAHAGARRLGLAGSVKLEVRAAAEAGRQDLAVELDLADAAVRVAGERTSASAVSLRAALADIFGATVGRASLEVEHLDLVDAALLELEELSIAAVAAAGTWTVDVATTGRGREPLELAARTRATPPRSGDARLYVELLRLDGTVLGETLAMESPARLTLAPATGDTAGGVTLEGLAVSLGHARVRGAIATTAAGARGRVDFSRLPLALLRFVPRTPSLDGTLDGHVETEAGAVRGRARFSGLRPLGRPDDGSGPAGTLAFDWTAEGLRAEGRMASGSGTDLGVTARLPMPAPGAGAGTAGPDEQGEPGELEVVVGGAVDAAELDEMLGVTGGAVAGALSVDMRMAGSAARPRLSGTATVAGGRYESRATAAVVQGVTARVTAREDTRLVFALEGGDGVDGTLAVDGAVELAGGLDALTYAASIRAQGARVAMLDEARVRADADLTLAGGPAGGTIAGDVRIIDADLRLAARGGERVTEIDVVEVNTGYARRRPARASDATAGRALGLDVAVAAPGQVFVRSAELESEWRGKIRVGGTTSAPEMAGALEVVRGHFGTAGVRFVLREGRVTLAPGADLDPVVFIVGEATRDEVLARLTISGTASQPSIELTSEPAMPSDEVLSRLLFGETASTLSAGQSVQLAAALSRLLRGGGGADPIGWVRRTFGVDHVSLSGSDEQGVAGTVVTVGKYVAPGVYVSVDQGASSQSSKARVEVDVSKHVSIESQVGTDSSGSLGVNWRWRY